MSDYILCHHGIKGQKWGIRRFQKKDGSLTPAGRKRYSENVEKAKTEMQGAKENARNARREYDKAYNKYAYIPTKQNYANLTSKAKKMQDADAAYRLSKVDYKVAKKDESGGFESTNKSKHRANLEEKYRKQGYTAKQAAIMADDRIRTEKILAGAAALTVTACAAYAVNKHIRDRTDQIIKSGDLLQRIEMQDTNGKLNDVFYTSKGEHDNKRYEGMLGFTRKQQTGHAYIMQLEATKDVKVASKDKAVKTFGELYKNDPEFRSQVEGHVRTHFGGTNQVKDIRDMSDKNIRKMYDNFNAALINIRSEGTGADKKFYDKLKDAGYGAIQDVNDMKYSGYRSKNPLIVFDNSNNNIMVKSMKEMTDAGDAGKYTKELGKALVEGEMDKLMSSPVAALTLTGAAGAMYVSDYKEDE